jgi:broad specificity phosphatase PhoE
MSVLYLVRHGQASAGAGDYDRLSVLGVDQSRALGELWAERELTFDRVFVGPLRRQRQTCDAVAEVYRRRGLPWPEPEPLPELDEHCGPKLVARLTPEVKAGLNAEAKLMRYLEVYQKTTRRWARGEVETPGDLEPWSAFRHRVRSGLGKMTDGGARGRSVAAFTSGGAVAAAVGSVLELADEKIIEISWRVMNAAVTEILFSSRTGRGRGAPDAGTPDRGAPGRRFILHTFNTISHLPEPELVTYI